MTTRSKPSLPHPILCLVTDHTYAQHQSLSAPVAMAIAGGVNMVQLREKELPGRELLALAQEMREVTQDKALLLVNERVDVALAAGADGVQLGEGAMPVEAVRELAGEQLLIGRSVHSSEGAQEAEAQGADFLIVGTTFPSASKPGMAPAGPELLSRIARAVTIPFLAIGGVNRENVDQVMEQGCSGVAVISAILGAVDPGQASRDLKEAILAATLTSSSHSIQAKR